jgi:hypothetical protein
MDHPSIVFETLTGIDNDSVFTDGYGRTWRKPTPVDSSREFVSFRLEKKLKFNFDLFSRDLAIAIHNDERRQLHEAQLRQRQTQGYYDERSSRKSKKKSHKSYRDDDYDSGCILS